MTRSSGHPVANAARYERRHHRNDDEATVCDDEATVDNNDNRLAASVKAKASLPKQKLPGCGLRGAFLTTLLYGNFCHGILLFYNSLKRHKVMLRCTASRALRRESSNRIICYSLLLLA
jgi:hypothetical protein